MNLGEHFRLGPAVQRMTDCQILDQWNACLRAQEQVRAAYEHVAVEILTGQPQIRYFERATNDRPVGTSSGV